LLCHQPGCSPVSSRCHTAGVLTWTHAAPLFPHQASQPRRVPPRLAGGKAHSSATGWDTAASGDGNQDFVPVQLTNLPPLHPGVWVRCEQGCEQLLTTRPALLAPRWQRISPMSRTSWDRQLHDQGSFPSSLSCFRFVSLFLLFLFLSLLLFPVFDFSAFFFPFFFPVFSFLYFSLFLFLVFLVSLFLFPFSISVFLFFFFLCPFHSFFFFPFFLFCFFPFFILPFPIFFPFCFSPVFFFLFCFFPCLAYSHFCL